MAQKGLESQISWPPANLSIFRFGFIDFCGSILFRPPVLLWPPVANYMLLYSPLLCKKIPRAPRGHKRFMLSKLGRRGGGEQYRSNYVNQRVTSNGCDFKDQKILFYFKNFFCAWPKFYRLFSITPQRYTKIVTKLQPVFAKVVLILAAKYKYKLYNLFFARLVSRIFSIYISIFRTQCSLISHKFRH